ncbi:hypothetical protein ZIOFF_053227 [Zingiber officinale]|uniref:Uncharacterized protein n=1 Tax=Zingiber officinale TaxID=94328 RepID=A0A8J5FC34_ZINOF|nr:hypothetical protein ZIOFF_053227 [Zingiber officinale]
MGVRRRIPFGRFFGLQRHFQPEGAAFYLPEPDNTFAGRKRGSRVLLSAQQHRRQHMLLFRTTIVPAVGNNLLDGRGNGRRRLAGVRWTAAAAQKAKPFCRVLFGGGRERERGRRKTKPFFVVPPRLLYDLVLPPMSSTFLSLDNLAFYDLHTTEASSFESVCHKKLSAPIDLKSTNRSTVAMAEGKSLTPPLLDVSILLGPKDLGALSLFRGVEVRPTSNGLLLSQQKDLGIHLLADTPLTLHGLSDADWAGDPDDRCSIIARSSTEAEYRAITSSTSEIQWIKSLLTYLLLPITTPAVLFTDNLGVTYNEDALLKKIHFEIESHMHFHQHQMLVWFKAWTFRSDELSCVHTFMAKDSSNSFSSINVVCDRILELDMILRRVEGLFGAPSGCPIESLWQQVEDLLCSVEAMLVLLQN